MKKKEKKKTTEFGTVVLRNCCKSMEYKGTLTRAVTNSVPS